MKTFKQYYEESINSIDINGYDFGGHDKPYNSFITVVDIESEKSFREMLKHANIIRKNPYIQQDIRKLFKLPPSKFINISKTLRYINVRYNKNIIKNIDNNLLIGGKIRLYDAKFILEPIITDLLRNNYKIIHNLELIDFGIPGEEYDEHLIILQKQSKNNSF